METPSTAPRLVCVLRYVFAALQCLLILGLLVEPLDLIRLPTGGKNQWHYFAEISFFSDAPELRAGQQYAGLKIEELTGKLSLEDADAAGEELVSIVRWPAFLSRFTYTLLMLLVCNLLWRLCRHVERGEYFSENNVTLVRRLGMLLIAAALSEVILDTFLGWRLSKYVDHQPISFGALRMLTYQVHLDIPLFTTGLVVIALATVFSHGLGLKQESELTV
jgi:hypothetical protein